LYRSENAAGGEPGAEGRARAYLQHFLQENAVQLQGILCGYVARMGMATGDTIATMAAEIFQDAALETLAHAERFNPNMQPRAWFLAIAANILKRHQASMMKRYRFEVLVGNLASRAGEDNELELLDRLMTAGTPGPEQALIARESGRELLSLVSTEDAQLLNLALVQDWNPSMLAHMLGVSPGAARVRVHRALSRLREAWKAQQEREEHNQYHG